MRIVFLTHYFPPEVGAPQTRIAEVAGALQRRGHSVSVVTGFPNYPDGRIQDGYRGRFAQREILNGLDVVRTPVYPAPNRGTARRLLNHASFAVSSLSSSIGLRRADVVVAETPPLFTADAGIVLARLLHASLVVNVADLWPQSAVELGVVSNRRLIRLAEALERRAYRSAARITVPTRGIARQLRDRGYENGKVVFLPNAVDVDRFDPVSPPAADVARIVYCGTVGMAQGTAVLVDACALLRAEGARFELLIVGDGAERQALEERAAGLGLREARFLGRVPAEQVPGLISQSYVCVVTLRGLPLFRGAVPTKVLDYMAAGRPIVAAVEGESADVVTEAGAGVVCEPENPGELARALAAVVADPERARRMGASGRRWVERNRSRAIMVAELERVLGEVVESVP